MDTGQPEFLEQQSFPEKRAVALRSVGTALGLTALKVTAGLATNSLGILSEAANSGLD
ncbi:MAG: hypothetical protein HW398_729, partial [Acidobacteria bacterium]|nr:hypothetical protein [Acidobacteriota bacterium]